MGVVRRRRRKPADYGFWVLCRLRLSASGLFIACGSSQAPPTSGSCAEGSVPEATAFTQPYLGLDPSSFGKNLFAPYLFELGATDFFSLSSAEV